MQIVIHTSDAEALAQALIPLNVSLEAPRRLHPDRWTTTAIVDIHVLPVAPGGPPAGVYIGGDERIQAALVDTPVDDGGARDVPLVDVGCIKVVAAVQPVPISPDREDEYMFGIVLKELAAPIRVAMARNGHSNARIAGHLLLAEAGVRLAEDGRWLHALVVDGPPSADLSDLREAFPEEQFYKRFTVVNSSILPKESLARIDQLACWLDEIAPAEG
ncbi:hypothetical protein [Sphingomonas corticis]|uniref:Uncharacterized protein n=1 Tax=Sphingomonas corticis TaxID=2722791 RepID=A0ABX1CQ77_9SPHN|nr:hypothetical protein [Sphingomonas corticis]NJR80059.1 hypothetical protein [Sphingomonas corticis]